MLLDSRNDTNRLFINFSNIFDNHGSIEIGPKLLIVSLSPPLCTDLIEEIFEMPGNFPILID